MNLKDLKKEIPFKWRVQQVNDAMTKAKCVAYIDARQVMDLLDEIVGPENWQSDFKEFKGNIYAGIGINALISIDDNKNLQFHWVWKWDCGAESNIEKEKGEASDAFKRAAVHWGIGRFLYELDIITIPAVNYKGKGKPADNQGNVLWSSDELSDFCNKQRTQKIELSDKAGQVIQYENVQEKPIKEPEKKNGNGYVLGDKLVKKHQISDKERATWEKKKTDTASRQKALDYIIEKIHYGEALEKEKYVKIMAKDKDKPKKECEEEARVWIIKNFAPLELKVAKEKYKVTKFAQEK